MNVYVIASNTAVKIGVSGNVQSRLASLQTTSQVQLKLVCCVKCVSESAAYALEGRLHEYYRAVRLKGEWFEVDPSIVIGNIQLALNIGDLMEDMVYQEIKKPPKHTVNLEKPVFGWTALIIIVLMFSCNLAVGGIMPLWFILLLGIECVIAMYLIYKG